MNRHRIILKVRIIAIMLMSNVALFGMNCSSHGILVISDKKNSDKVYQQFQIFLPFDVMQKTAAGGNGEVKNTLQKTCWFYKNSFSKNNHLFVSHESFTADKQDVIRIMCSAVWFNNVLLENALRKHYNVRCIRFETTFETTQEYSFSIPVRNLKKLRKKYNNNNEILVTPYRVYKELTSAFYVSLACNDIEAINNISPKMRKIAYAESDKIARHIYVLKSIIQKDHTEIFELVVKHDPFRALNSRQVYDDESDELFETQSCLEILNSSEDIPQDLRDKYIALYRKHGGKTAEELQKKQTCIVS
jgi:hypothetical protein